MEAPESSAELSLPSIVEYRRFMSSPLQLSEPEPLSGTSLGSSPGGSPSPAGSSALPSVLARGMAKAVKAMHRLAGNARRSSSFKEAAPASPRPPPSAAPSPPPPAQSPCRPAPPDRPFSANSPLQHCQSRPCGSGRCEKAASPLPATNTPDFLSSAALDGLPVRQGGIVAAPRPLGGRPLGRAVGVPVAWPAATYNQLPEPARAAACKGPKATPPPQQNAFSKLLAVSPALPPAMRRPVWRLEQYAVHKRLYKGATSACYRATCQHSGLTVALKVYFFDKVPDNMVHMLKREIEIHTQLVHKNVLKLYGAFMDEHRAVLVMEYAARGDLYSIVQRLGFRLPEVQAVDVVLRPFLEALAYLHSRGICHRDVKPENILFTHDWRLVVADFGVSIDLGQERAVTRAGTEGYMAPEVERCPLKADPQENKDKPELAYSTAVDIWATGVLAYELLCGFPPSIGPADKPHSRLLEDTSLPLTALHFPPTVPALARDFIVSALAPLPEERPTAAQLLHHPWLQSRAAGGSETIVQAAPAAQAPARHESASSVPSPPLPVGA